MLHLIVSYSFVTGNYCAIRLGCSFLLVASVETTLWFQLAAGCSGWPGLFAWNFGGEVGRHTQLGLSIDASTHGDLRMVRLLCVAAFP